MKKSKRSTRRDRLSELPDSLILVILSLLPMRDVVRTTLLSKRWKDIWTTVPCLNFNSDRNDFADDEDGKDRLKNFRFPNFVNRALVLWKGTKILKFKVVLFDYEEPPSSDLDLWLRFAIENEVEELYVNLLNDWEVSDGYVDTGYRALRSLYSCLSIRKLSLVGCHLEIHGNIQWYQLKYLTIDGVPLSEHVLNQVLSGTPQLEVLILRLMESEDNLNIHSSSLKMLTIKTYVSDETTDTVLTIWAPNVETLEISGDLYSKCVLMNVSSLTNATVGFYYDPDDYDPEDYDIGRFSGYKLLKDILGQVYQTDRHVEKVTLSYWCIKMLGEIRKQDMHMLAPLSNAKFVKLYGCKVNEIVDLLQIFPKLMMLGLEDERMDGWGDIFEIHCDIKEPFITKFDTENSLEAKTDFPKSCLLHLTKVEITWIQCDDSVLLLAEFLLKNASKLEKLVFRGRRSMSLEPESFLLTAEKLLRMPRSSPTAEVILCRK